MGKREQISVGDLVCLISNDKFDDNYAELRNVGVVTEVRGDFLYHVKWVSAHLSPCWYQKRTLIKLNNQKNKNNYLTDVA
jgi:hypothetical protein